MCTKRYYENIFYIFWMCVSVLYGMNIDWLTKGMLDNISSYDYLLIRDTLEFETMPTQGNSQEILLSDPHDIVFVHAAQTFTIFSAVCTY